MSAAIMGAHRAGFITLIGRPNVGKSTLLNAILGEKLAIVTPKPQTTRDRILGIHPVEGGQLVFIDTPGVHFGKKALNKHLIEVALATLDEVDVVLFVLDAGELWRRGPARQQPLQLHAVEETILGQLREKGRKTIAVLNKVDKVKRKPDLLPMIEALDGLGAFEAIVPVSATRHRGFEGILKEALALLPESPPLYPEDELTDRPIRFLVAELLREQLFMALRDELPYSVAVEISRFRQREDRKLVDIDATIHVERQSQKGIVLGKGGQTLKAIAQAARLEMESLIGTRVYLRTFVRVEPNWTKSEKGLRKLGYEKPK